MPRRPRFVVPEVPHHITQRGNNRQSVFVSDESRQRYVEILGEHAYRHELRILGWCLMSNHVHLIVVPGHEKSVARALGQAHSRYTLELNRERGWIGHLWQNRFFSCSLDHQHFLRALHYVEQNPVRAGMVNGALDWRWSSARAHSGLAAHDALLAGDWRSWMAETRSGGWDEQAWRESLESAVPDEELARMRRATRLGEPLGSAAFVGELERVAGRRLRVWDPGRPAKQKAAAVGQGAVVGE
jgi:putative transposase